MYGKTIESAIVTNFINKYQQLKLLASNLNIDNTLIEKKEENKERIMNASIKLKSIFNAFFQSQNTSLVQKSMKHVNAYDSNPDANEYRKKREKNNESVRKSRAKNRIKIQECAKVVAELRTENTQLNSKLANLQSELVTLKGLFQHCFSFNLSSLPIKPSDVPTSTLYKIIMKTEPPKSTEAILNNTNSQLKFLDNSINTNATTTSKMEFNEIDNFYLNQIKNALSNITKPDINKMNVDNSCSNMLLKHDFSTSLIMPKSTI